MKMIVGLGNPGSEYRMTKHNIGFLVLDRMNYGIFNFQKKFDAEILQVSKNLVAIKPQTFMNLSGEAVYKVANFYKIQPKDILIIHDEIDFEFGRIASKFSGGTAGHNGLKSIVQKLGTPDFWRIRIGVGRPQSKMEISDYVLSKFTEAEQKILFEEKFETIKDNIEIFLNI